MEIKEIQDRFDRGYTMAIYGNRERIHEQMTNDIEKLLEAIDYKPCCTELNPEFEVGEQVLLTKRTLVSIETFCEDGMIEIDDNNEYYKVYKDELSKRV